MKIRFLTALAFALFGSAAIGADAPKTLMNKHSVMLGAGTEASFRNFRVWEALPNSEWAKNKQAILATSQPAAK